MSFESLYKWKIRREWAENLNTEYIFENKQDNNLYFLRIIQLLTGLHALILVKNFEKAKICIDYLVTMMTDLETADGLNEKLFSKKVLSHVVNATIQKSYEKLEQVEKAAEFESKLVPLELATDLERSTLFGIQSFCFYLYCRRERSIEVVETTINFARSARELNPEFSYWNLVNASSLRRLRRGGFLGPAKEPTYLEWKLYDAAYHQNSHPYFGVRLARCYKELRNCEKTLRVYEEMKQTKIEDPEIWLKMALGYIYFKEFELAKECLDEAEKIDDSSLHLQHYKGLYYLKGFQNIEEAKIHLKEASDRGKYNAFMDYLYCLYLANANDQTVLKLLEESLETRKHKHDFAIGLSIALYYGKNLKDYEKCLIKLRDTVKDNPQDSYLRKFFYNFTKKSKYLNILNYIETELLPKAKSVLEPENREAWEAFEFLESLAKFNKNSQNQFCTDLSDDVSAD